ncbi:uncharacterized protein LOC143852359 [Tasmannia lanceolata]|uniref:uncharacterized protein LOC143852359 n=1 Tax=Tasmannia lanceolata TaxID=3420 RepID=UPI004063153E
MEEIRELFGQKQYLGVGDASKRKVDTGCKWLFTVKQNADGSVERHNARLVAKSSTQTYDDIVLTGNCTKEMQNFGGSFGQGLRGQKRAFLRQRKYVLNLLKETGMLVCKPANTTIYPFTTSGKTVKGDLMDTGTYQRLVGKKVGGLIYLTYIRLDLDYADWANSVGDRRSTSGYTFVGYNLVTW